MNTLKEMVKLGQSIWYDNIKRSLLDSGELKGFFEAGVRGVTSNPSIFEKAIAGSGDYDEALCGLVEEGLTVGQIYETLAIDDIRSTADLLLPLYKDTGGADGFVSLEVNPTLAKDTGQSVAEAKRLYSTLGRPNVMIKIPATKEGIPAIEILISEGINVNVTLIFSLENYEQVVEAYISGLEQLAEKERDLSRVASVASFFVSRVDSMVDPLLEEAGASDLRGKIAIANAKVAYERFKELFHGERWEKLAKLGALVQRPLWASTSTKNPDYPDTLYVDSLIGPHTVNTVPPVTLDALMDHSVVENRLEVDVQASHQLLAELETLDISYKDVTEKLQEEGVAAFAQSFQSMLNSIQSKRDELLVGSGA